MTTEEQIVGWDENRAQGVLVTDPERTDGHAAPHSVTLDPANGYVTSIDSYTVAPERALELLDFLTRSTEETLKYVPGFISANIHLSLDHTKIVNYAQWENEEAIKAAQSTPEVAELMQNQLQIAESFTPVLYELRSSIAGT